jgi:hypothetical protein
MTCKKKTKEHRIDGFEHDVRTGKQAVDFTALLPWRLFPFLKNKLDD